MGRRLQVVPIAHVDYRLARPCRLILPTGCEEWVPRTIRLRHPMRVHGVFALPMPQHNDRQGSCRFHMEAPAASQLDGFFDVL
jgi:hypothetical protein